MNRTKTYPLASGETCVPPRMYPLTSIYQDGATSSDVAERAVTVAEVLEATAALIRAQAVGARLARALTAREIAAELRLPLSTITALLALSPYGLDVPTEHAPLAAALVREAWATPTNE